MPLEDEDVVTKGTPPLQPASPGLAPNGLPKPPSPKLPTHRLAVRPPVAPAAQLHELQPISVQEAAAVSAAPRARTGPATAVGAPVQKAALHPPPRSSALQTFESMRATPNGFLGTRAAVRATFKGRDAEDDTRARTVVAPGVAGTAIRRSRLPIAEPTELVLDAHGIAAAAAAPAKRSPNSVITSRHSSRIVVAQVRRLLGTVGAVSQRSSRSSAAPGVLAPPGRQGTNSNRRPRSTRPTAHVEIASTQNHLEIKIGTKVHVNQPTKITVDRYGNVVVQVGKDRAIVAQSKQDRDRVDQLRKATVGGTKIVYPLVTVLAAKIAGLPVSLACAILGQESSGGLNEWGHDPTIFKGGHDKAHNRQYPEFPISQAAYFTYKTERGSAKAPDVGKRQQGVGPGQLTTAWKQDQADLLGGAWKPLPNMIEAFSLLRASIQRDGLRATVVAYNGSGARAEKYADVVLAHEREWAQALGMKSIQR